MNTPIKYSNREIVYFWFSPLCIFTDSPWYGHYLHGRLKNKQDYFANIWLYGVKWKFNKNVAVWWRNKVDWSFLWEIPLQHIKQYGWLTMSIRRFQRVRLSAQQKLFHKKLNIMMWCRCDRNRVYLLHNVVRFSFDTM
jgi:hypothetical protein